MSVPNGEGASLGRRLADQSTDQDERITPNRSRRLTVNGSELHVLEAELEELRGAVMGDG
ncbi:hypothetical protein [Actinospongicola halichondriae]|uniref:hypothetical protein n=1 Tax=Actinospongicola halichondriae TaxID=3236844 RepID=UPI003D56B2D5